MPRQVLAVQFGFPGNVAEFVSFRSDRSLMDGDVIVFSPVPRGNYSSYLGLGNLQPQDARQLNEDLTHWYREIRQVLNAGKNVFVFLEEPDELEIPTGYTTRNRAYWPFESMFSVVPATGNEFRRGNGFNLIASYWDVFEKFSTYVCYLGDDTGTPLLTSKTGRYLAALIPTDGGGNIVCLPKLQFDFDDLYIEHDDEEGEEEEQEEDPDGEWTPEGLEIGHQLLQAILEIDKTLHSETDKTPTPQWANTVEFQLQTEKELSEKIDATTNKIDKLEVELQHLKTRLKSESILRGLLFENGKPLEAAVLKALRELDFKHALGRSPEMTHLRS